MAGSLEREIKRRTLMAEAELFEKQAGSLKAEVHRLQQRIERLETDARRNRQDAEELSALNK